MTPSQKQHSILVVCIDSLRADAIFRSPQSNVWKGDLSPATPVMDRFAEESISFPHACSVSAWTKPVVPSIFTSLYPSEHGVLETAKDADRGVTSPPMPQGASTLATALRALGYRTSGIGKNAQFETIASFDRGFDFFTSNMEASGGLGMFHELGITDGGTPSFTYLHMMEPHWPFSSRVADTLHASSSGRFPFHRFSGDEWKSLKTKMRRREVVLTESEIRFLKLTYAAAVEEADASLGRIWEDLRDEDNWNDMLVIVTADHGEELNDHGAVGHGQSLYDELVHVPLLIKPPRSMDSKRREQLERNAADVVSLLDLHPTTLGILGEDTSKLHVSGIDLTVNGNEGRTIFAEVKHKRRYHEAAITKRWKLIREHRFAKDKDAKQEDYNNLDQLFRDRKCKTTLSLFDRRQDPGEQVNRAPGEKARTKELSGELDRWRSTLRKPSAAPDSSVDEEIIRRLQKLGYM